MPDRKTIDIKLTRDVIDKTGRRLPRGQKLRTTRKELVDREVPEEAYELLVACSGLPPAGDPEKPAKTSGTDPEGKPPKK